MTCARFIHRDAGYTVICACNDHRVIWNLPDTVNREDLVDVVHFKHILIRNHLRTNAVDDKFEDFFLCAAELADDLIGIADGGYFRHGDDKGLVCCCDSRLKALFDARGAIDEDIVEFLSKLFAKFLHFFGIDCRFILDLRGWQKIE